MSIENAGYAAAVLLCSDGRVVLQFGDDKPKLRNPGRIGPFGGGAEAMEPRWTAPGVGFEGRPG